MAFDLRLDIRVHEDIENATDYYFEKSVKVAEAFYDDIQNAYLALQKNPFFQFRYLDYRCLPLKVFPFMFHFTVNEKKKVVYIHALISTAKNPAKSWLKSKGGK